TIAKGPAVLKMFLPHEFAGYYNLYTHILIWNIVLAFKDRYKHINEQLANVSNKSLIKDTGKIIRLVGEMVGLFNDLFGLPLVFITGRCVLRILASSNFF